MKRYIAFLRGINISGKNKVPMAELKQGFERLNYTEVKTYLNSGNVIFSSDENRKLYEKMEQSRTVLSADSISSFKKSDLEKYKKYIDDNKKETFEKAKPVTREDLIKFLKEARKDYTDEELEFVKNKFNELSEEKISPKL